MRTIRARGAIPGSGRYTPPSAAIYNAVPSGVRAADVGPTTFSTGSGDHRALAVSCQAYDAIERMSGEVQRSIFGYGEVICGQCRRYDLGLSRGTRSRNWKAQHQTPIGYADNDRGSPTRCRPLAPGEAADQGTWHNNRSRAHTRALPPCMGTLHKTPPNESAMSTCA